MASLLEQWNEMLENLQDSEKETFAQDYYALEQAVYQEMLSNPDETITGTFSELAKRFGFENVLFAGYMDGVNESLKKPYDTNTLKPNNKIVLDVDFEKLYYNMLDAGATWLSGLEEWDNVLTQERRDEIAKERRKGMQAVSNKIGRNEPCPCGSGKKYKKCCGKTA